MRSRERRSSSRSRRGCIRCGCSASLRSRARSDSRRRTALGMPELPDVVVYVESLDRRIAGQRLDHVRLISPFVLRTVVPPLAAAEGRRVDTVRRLGKRIVICLEAELFLVLHLMIAGRLRWLERGQKLPARITLASFEFATGTVAFTEAGTKKRASLHVVQGEAALAAFDMGGLDIAGSTLAAFRERLLRENHTLKRALTDPRLFSGIGNAYSDEILHRARLSPLLLTSKMAPEEISGLHRAVQEVLSEATERLRREAGGGFPEGVTAFRDWMAVHGRFRKPCPACGRSVQRIVYAENET